MIDLALDKKHLWHPYTSMLNPLPVYPVASASGSTLMLEDGQVLVDGMSSWWCAAHGYSHPVLVEAIQNQAEKMSHVMFGGLTHEPAIELCKRLLSVLPEGLEHLFYADSGSVAVEIAMKMAVQYQEMAGNSQKKRFFALKGAYHGDTWYAMSVCDPIGGMHSLYSGALPEAIFCERPLCRFDEAWDPKFFTEIEASLRENANDLAAVILEPVVQGAGGMWFYHPQYLVEFRRVCSELEILLIADEIATGFGRTGKFFACEWAGITPDILCMGKVLTGGTMTMSAVAATSEVAKGVSSQGLPFMHGPTFMANPLACAAAVASFDLLVKNNWGEQVKRIERQLKAGLERATELETVKDVRVLGSIGVVELHRPVNLAKIQAFYVEEGVWIRPFGKLVYIMPPYIIKPAELTKLTAALIESIKTGEYLQ